MTPQTKPISEKAGADDAPVTLVAIRETESGKHLILTVSSGDAEHAAQTRYTVSLPVYHKIGFPVRYEKLTDLQIEQIRREDERFRATKQAIRMLACADNNRRMLRRKLCAKGFSGEAADAAVREMVASGYLSEDKQLERIIQNEVNLRFTGPGKLLPKLCAKGYAARDVERMIRTLEEEGKIDFAKSKQKMLEHGLSRLAEKTDDPDRLEEEKKRLLYKNGYRTI